LVRVWDSFAAPGRVLSLSPFIRAKPTIGFLVERDGAVDESLVHAIADPVARAVSDDFLQLSDREESDEDERVLRREVHQLLARKQSLQSMLGDEGGEGVRLLPHAAQPPVTFFSPEIERLIEGLPGALDCVKYKYAALFFLLIHSLSATNDRFSESRTLADKRQLDEEDAGGEEEDGWQLYDDETNALAPQPGGSKEDRKKLKELERQEKKQKRSQEVEARKHARDAERLAKAFRKQLEADVQKLRNVARNVVSSFCDLEGAKGVDESDDDDDDDDGRHSATKRTPPVPLRTPNHSLSQDHVSTLLQIRDFLVTFSPELSLSRVPSLDTLFSALQCQQRTASDAAPDHSRIDAARRTLHAVAIALVKPMLPHYFEHMFTVEWNEISEQLVPLNERTWPHLAREFLCKMALQDTETKDADIYASIRGVAADHELRGLDDRTQLLLWSRMTDRYAASQRRVAADESTSSSPLTVSLPLPHGASWDRSQWRYHIHRARAASPDTGIEEVVDCVKAALALMDESDPNHAALAACLDPFPTTPEQVMQLQGSLQSLLVVPKGVVATVRSAVVACERCVDPSRPLFPSDTLRDLSAAAFVERSLTSEALTAKFHETRGIKDDCRVRVRCIHSHSHTHRLRRV
jgi:hypothetical protein